MSREIKFRGLTQNKEWKVGFLSKDYTDTYYITSLDGVDTWVINPETIGQFWIPSLGLKCYGGDLLTAVCSVFDDKKKKERICKVSDTDSGFGISVWHEGVWHAYSTMDFTTAKVIGNIHDNPELIK